MKYFIVALFSFFCFSGSAQGIDFSYQSSTGAFCAPASVNFTNQAGQGVEGFIWDFGDGSGSNAANPSHTFSSAGTYVVKMLVIFKQSATEVSKSVTIHSPNSVGLTADRNYICRPGNIIFTATGGSQANYSWNFGDGTNSSSPANPMTHSFGNFGNYTVTLQVTDTNGCSATASIPVEVKNPPITGTANPTRGCVPVNTGFSATVTVPSGSTVSSYTWDFGDGATNTTSVNNTSHTYPNRGSYYPKVSVTTSEGCAATYDFPLAAFGTPPTNINAYPLSDSVCASDQAKFVATATGASLYVWQFGDGTSATVPDTLVMHKYNSLGTKNISVVPFDNGCPGAGASFDIETIGVIASYNFSINCSQRDRVTFTNQSSGNISSFLWNYGDGQQNDTVLSPVHIFPPNGSFNTTLSIYDSLTGCSDQFQRPIVTAVPVLTNTDTAICRNDVTFFKVENSYPNPNAKYTYHGVGTVSPPMSTDYLYQRAYYFGAYSNYVVIDNGPQYCLDTAWLDHNILVRGPDLDFRIDSSICIYDSLSFTNLSTPYRPQDSINNWTWRVAGDTLDGFQPSPYLFSSKGIQPVKLFATDINGCQDSLAKQVVVNGLPFLRVIPESDTICAGTIDTLIAFHNDPVSWTSNLTVPCITCDTIAVAPNTNAYYAVRATSAAGCISADTISIRVYEPFNAIALNPVSYICPGDTLSLRLSPPGMKVQWNSSPDIQRPSVYDPVVSPMQTTQYKAVLQDSAGCFTDSASYIVNVNSAAAVNAGPDTTVAYNSNFIIQPQYSNNVVQYLWSPPGDLNCISCPSPSGTAKENYSYSIRITSDSGCIATDTINIFIRCDDANLLLPNAFTPNNDQLNDVFYPIGRGIRSIRRFSIYDRGGRVIFEKRNISPNDPLSGWNGRINGEPAAGAVYVYIIEALCGKGELISKKGTVVLLR